MFGQWWHWTIFLSYYRHILSTIVRDVLFRGNELSVHNMFDYISRTQNTHKNIIINESTNDMHAYAIMYMDTLNLLFKIDWTFLTMWSYHNGWMSFSSSTIKVKHKSHNSLLWIVRRGSSMHNLCCRCKQNLLLFDLFKLSFSFAPFSIISWCVHYFS